MTRLQLISSGMLQKRLGHLSIFRPAVTELLSILFLLALKDIPHGPVIVPMLYDNAINAEEDVTTKRGRMSSRVTNKQKKALHELNGFLNVDPAADVQLKKSNSPADSDDDEDSLPDEPNSKKKDPVKKKGTGATITSPDSEGEKSLPADEPKSKKGTKKAPAKKGKKGTAASKKKKGEQAKVKPFSNTTVHTPALEKKLNHRGNSKGDDKRRSPRAKKNAEEVVINDDSNDSAKEVLEEQKKVLQAIQKATQEQKRQSVILEKTEKALKKREGKYY
jgi:hypothetical protein